MAQLHQGWHTRRHERTDTRGNRSPEAVAAVNCSSGYLWVYCMYLGMAMEGWQVLSTFARPSRSVCTMADSSVAEGPEGGCDENEDDRPGVIRVPGLERRPHV